MYNSKYTGEEVEALLDKVSSGDMFQFTDIAYDQGVFKVRNIISNKYVYMAFDGSEIFIQVPNGSDLFASFTVRRDPSNYIVHRILNPALIGAGSIVALGSVAGNGSAPDLYGIAFCDTPYSSWGAIPDRYKKIFV